ncbi:MAG: transposase, partial [Halobacteria archaeon]
GMAEMGEVAIDGRRIQGDSAIEQNRTRKQIEEEIEQILDEANEVDEKEDEEYGPESRGDELPDELQDKESRLNRLREAKAKLDEKEQRQKERQREKIQEREEKERDANNNLRGRKPKPPEKVELDEDARVNITDPESQTMKSRDGWKQGYNGQTMVDCDTQVIVAQDVTTDANDVEQLEPMLDECREVNEKTPSKVLADAGYWSKSNAKLEEKHEDLELFIATVKDWKRRKELRERTPPRGPIPDSYGPKELMERKLRTKSGRDIYRKRGRSVEPVSGQHVNRDLDRFMLRGKQGAEAEWSLFSATHNLLKLWRERWKSAG